MGALENLACAAVIADLGKDTYSENEFQLMYRDKEKHGPTMKAFMAYANLDEDGVTKILQYVMSEAFSFNLTQNLWSN